VADPRSAADQRFRRSRENGRVGEGVECLAQASHASLERSGAISIIVKDDNAGPDD